MSSGLSWVDEKTEEVVACGICKRLIQQPVNPSTCPHWFCRACLTATALTSCSRAGCGGVFSGTLHDCLAFSDCVSAYWVQHMAQQPAICPHCRVWQGTLGVELCNVMAHQDECGDARVQCRVCTRRVPRRHLNHHKCHAATPTPPVHTTSRRRSPARQPPNRAESPTAAAPKVKREERSH